MILFLQVIMWICGAISISFFIHSDLVNGIIWLIGMLSLHNKIAIKKNE